MLEEPGVGAQAVADEVVRREVIDTRAQSIAHLFRQRVAASGSREALQYLVPDAGTESGERVERLTWDQTRERADLWAAGLVALGVGLEDRVAIASTTRVEWVLADLAIMTAGAATTTIYPTMLDADVAFIVADSGSKVVFAENDGAGPEAARPPRRAARAAPRRHLRRQRGRRRERDRRLGHHR